MEVGESRMKWYTKITLSSGALLTSSSGTCTEAARKETRDEGGLTKALGTRAGSGVGLKASMSPHLGAHAGACTGMRRSPLPLTSDGQVGVLTLNHSSDGQVGVLTLNHSSFLNREQGKT